MSQNHCMLFNTQTAPGRPSSRLGFCWTSFSNLMWTCNVLFYLLKYLRARTHTFNSGRWFPRFHKWTHHQVVDLLANIFFCLLRRLNKLLSRMTLCAKKVLEQMDTRDNSIKVRKTCTCRQWLESNHWKVVVLLLFFFIITSSSSNIFSNVSAEIPMSKLRVWPIYVMTFTH